ncbi:MSHA biogenesis protein MshI [Shewanella sp. Scap07]|uniref:MSHA biogenesis protein MshI n=1 Tax=Shewanella sp. Scap07 TaxID=2589987 RepID=UPI0015BB24F5|nr:MSHA biogenesis protein MshI [Shewanella sp. Scap07]QLE87093.1 MSHA biogenesis protein MshI [Shewanella sp. Scap07]
MDKSLFNKLAFWKKTGQQLDVGLYLTESALHVFQPANDTLAESYHSFAYTADPREAFSAMQQALGATRAQLVLNPSFYQLLLVDKPAVDIEEMNQALIWSVKDMVTIAVANIHVDYFEAPEVSSNKLTAVVADKAVLGQLVTDANQHGIDIVGISIEELAISNLFIDDTQPKLVLCHLPEHELLLTVVRQGKLYMQRRVRGFSGLDKVTQEELGFGMADNLSLEIQRSMDFFESQLRQSPVASIELVMGGQAQALAQLLASNFNQTVNVVAANSIDQLLAQLAFAEFARADEVSEEVAA